MMQRIEAERSLPMPIATRRGASANAITDAGGNPRLDISGEQTQRPTASCRAGLRVRRRSRSSTRPRRLRSPHVDPWVEERKQLPRRARDIIRDYDGNPRTLYPHFGQLVRAARRPAEIKVIFETYNCERNRHTDANVTGLVEYVGGPKTMEGIDD